MLISTLLLQYALAIEPMNPVEMCKERMIHVDEREQCIKKAKTLKLDEYAATACNALDNDKKFLICWQSVSGGVFNPDALSRCVESGDDSDDAILSCIVSLKNRRLPASVRRPYQPLTVPKKATSKKLDPKK